MKYETFEIDGYSIFVSYYDSQSELLLEAKTKGEPLIGTYSVIKHQRHTPDGDYHLHVYDGQNQIFAINKGGLAHDGYHGVRIPNKVYQELKKRYNGWHFPPNKIIETVNFTYILKPLDELTYKEIINEITTIQGERDILETFKSLIGKSHILNENISKNDIRNQIEQVTERFKELFLESVRRI